MRLRRAVRRYVAAVVKRNFGFYPIEDKDFHDSWMAQLKKVDMKRVRRVFEDEYILRGIFIEKPVGLEESESEEGAPKKALKLQTFEVDFTVVRGKAGRWRVTDSALYGIGADKLFAYSEKHDRIPLERDKTVSVFFFTSGDAAEEQGSAPGKESDDSFDADADPKDEGEAPGSNSNQLNFDDPGVGLDGNPYPVDNYQPDAN